LSDAPGGRSRKLDFASGGWVLLLALIAALAVTAYLALPGLLGRDRDRLGDGEDPASYGFDLSNLTVPRDLLVASGMPRDGLLPLTSPEVWTPERVERWNEENRGKYLVDADRVIGVALGDEARAYPLRVLNWHEIANDTLGGRPIAVTYNPLTDAAVAFDRRLEDGPVVFGHSGLLYNSNLLLYDRRPRPEASTLWSQLLAEGVAGPRAGQPLEVLPASVCRWDTWQRAHPETSVVAPEPRWMKKYKRAPYTSYFGSDQLRFPVRPLPRDDRRLKTRVLALQHQEHTRVIDFEREARAGSERIDAVVGGVAVSLRLSSAPPGYLLEQPAGTEGPVPNIRTFHAFRFAWYAMHPPDRAPRGTRDQMMNKTTNITTQTASR
jgi:hypothetical protein